MQIGKSILQLANKVKVGLQATPVLIDESRDEEPVTDSTADTTWMEYQLMQYRDK